MQKLVEKHMKQLQSISSIVGPCSFKLSDVKTGTWRYKRPVINQDKCIRCSICADYCPCGVIERQEDKMIVDYDYCKGCGICIAECPKKAIDFRLEAELSKEEK